MPFRLAETFPREDKRRPFVPADRLTPRFEKLSAKPRRTVDCNSCNRWAGAGSALRAEGAFEDAEVR